MCLASVFVIQVPFCLVEDDGGFFEDGVFSVLAYGLLSSLEDDGVAFAFPLLIEGVLFFVSFWKDVQHSINGQKLSGSPGRHVWWGTGVF